jgi:hypothetical protein
MFHKIPPIGAEFVESDESTDRWTDTWTLRFDLHNFFTFLKMN